MLSDHTLLVKLRNSIESPNYAMIGNSTRLPNTYYLAPFQPKGFFVVFPLVVSSLFHPQKKEKQNKTKKIKFC